MVTINVNGDRLWREFRSRLAQLSARTRARFWLGVVTAILFALLLLIWVAWIRFDTRYQAMAIRRQPEPYHVHLTSGLHAPEVHGALVRDERDRLNVVATGVGGEQARRLFAELDSTPLHRYAEEGAVRFVPPERVAPGVRRLVVTYEAPEGWSTCIRAFVEPRSATFEPGRSEFTPTSPEGGYWRLAPAPQRGLLGTCPSETFTECRSSFALEPEGTLALSVRVPRARQGGFSLLLSGSRNAELVYDLGKGRLDAKPSSLLEPLRPAGRDLPLPDGRTISLKLIRAGGRIRALVDGALHLEFVDLEPDRTLGSMLRVYDGCSVAVTEFRVRGGEPECRDEVLAAEREVRTRYALDGMPTLLSQVPTRGAWVR